MIYDFTKRGDFRRDAPMGAVRGFLDIADLWPGDVVVVSFRKMRIAIDVLGTGDMQLRGPRGREGRTFRLEQMKDGKRK